jgi:hypothetical protein
VRASAKFALASIVGAVAAVAWVARPVTLDREEADGRAARVLAAYVADAGEIEGHFEARPTVAYADGWDYRWAYLPCANVAELRVFVTTRGRASITATPDCEDPRQRDGPVLA